MNKVLLISLVLSALISLFTLLFARFLPPKLPFFYSLPWGDKQLVDHSQLLIIPATISLVALCNLIISWQLHPTQALFKSILLFSSLLISLILTIAFIKIVLIFL